MAQAHVDYLNSTVRDELIKASVAMYKAQPANKHKFLADYFAKLSAEREGAAVEEKKEAAPKPPKRKKVKMALSDVVFDCTPDTDVEFEWDQVKADIADILLTGVLWAPDFILQDFVFGLKKLTVVAQIMDAKVPTTSVIVEALQTIRGIGGVEMLSIECAGADWEETGTGRKGTTRPPTKKGGKGGKGGKQQQQQQSKKSKKKKKKGKKADQGPRVVTPEMIKKDSTKIAISCKESDFYVTTVPEMDGSAQTNVSTADLQTCLAQVREKVPNCALMIAASGSTNLSAIASVPGGQISALDWLKSIAQFSNAQGNATEATADFLCDADKGEFPIKMKDTTSAAAFAFLKKAGVLEEESAEEFYTLDDDEEGY